MATCQICRYAGNPKDKPPCADCKGYSKYEYEKPKTNADRIRAMSDEELATDLLNMFQDICEDGAPSKEWMLEWLKQPAEE